MNTGLTTGYIVVCNIKKDSTLIIRKQCHRDSISTYVVVVIVIVVMREKHTETIVHIYLMRK